MDVYLEDKESESASGGSEGDEEFEEDSSENEATVLQFNPVLPMQHVCIGYIHFCTLYSTYSLFTTFTLMFM